GIFVCHVTRTVEAVTVASTPLIASASAGGGSENGAGGGVSGGTSETIRLRAGPTGACCACCGVLAWRAGSVAVLVCGRRVAVAAGVHEPARGRRRSSCGAEVARCSPGATARSSTAAIGRTVPLRPWCPASATATSTPRTVTPKATLMFLEGDTSFYGRSDTI